MFGVFLQERAVLREFHSPGILHALDVRMGAELLEQGGGDLDLGDFQSVLDAHDAGSGGVLYAEDLEGGLDRLAIGLHDHRNVGPVEEGGGEDVGISRLEVDALEEAAGDDIGQADAVGVDDVFIRLGCGWHPTFLGQTMGEHSRRPVVEKVEDSVIHMPKSFVLVKYRVPLQKLLERMES